MATAKKAAKKSGSTALVKWEEKFGKYAKETKEQVKNVANGGVGISFGHNAITVGGNKMPNGKLSGIILGSCAFNAWYKTKYNAAEKVPPDCYAFAIVVEDPDMKPHQLAPSKQNEDCASCEKNQFGTSSTGKGKACSNNIRIGVLLGKDVEDGASALSAELATGKISPTNMKYYKEYTDLLEAEHNRPPWAVVTEITSHDDSDTQIRLEFKMVELIEDDEILEALEKRYLGIQQVLQVPFAAVADKKPAAGASKKFAPKKTAAKGKR